VQKGCKGCGQPTIGQARHRCGSVAEVLYRAQALREATRTLRTRTRWLRAVAAYQLLRAAALRASRRAA